MSTDPRDLAAMIPDPALRAEVQRGQARRAAAEAAQPYRGRHRGTGPQCCDDYPHMCPPDAGGCGRIMSHREATEQALCNDCAGATGP